MKIILSVFLTMIAVGCAFAPDTAKEEFVAAPGAIDERIESASIEDYIIALPSFAYHEESVSQFSTRVRNARNLEKRNKGKDANYLFVPGDGSWPSKAFYLDPDSGTLTIRIFNWEPLVKDYTETMRRVPGGWMRGPGIEIRDAKIDAPVTDKLSGLSPSLSSSTR
jgi:hypothetical protein